MYDRVEDPCEYPPPPKKITTGHSYNYCTHASKIGPRYDQSNVVLVHVPIEVCFTGKAFSFSFQNISCRYSFLLFLFNWTSLPLAVSGRPEVPTRSRVSLQPTPGSVVLDNTTGEGDYILLIQLHV